MARRLLTTGMDVKALTGFACALALTALVHAQAPPQALESVRGAAEKAVRATLDANTAGVAIKAATLHARLALPDCAQRLDTFVPELRMNQARLLVRVNCANPAWSLNVPVELRRTHDVLVLKRAVGRGQIVGAADVDVQKRELPGLTSPFVGSLAELDNRITRRPVPAGTALPADALTAALLIHRGQTVMVA